MRRHERRGRAARQVGARRSFELVRPLRRGRQTDGKRRAAVYSRALGRDRAFVRLDQLLRDRQTEPDAAVGTAAVLSA